MDNTPSIPRRPLALALIPVGLILASVVFFLLVSRMGAGLTAAAPGPENPAVQSGGKVVVLPHVLLALVVIVVAARVVGIAFAWLGQPAVIGEVVAGILLGPS